MLANLISQSDGLSRSELDKLVEETYKISKPTLVRDLNTLLKGGFVKMTGAGRGVKYQSSMNHPQLRFFDLESYFLVDPDKRETIKKFFDFEVFSELKNLITKEESLEVEEKKRSFHLAVSGLAPEIYRRELERFVIELSWKSSKIEGNTYSLLETEALIKEAREPEGKSREEKVMILNHKATFDQILKNRRDFRKISVSQINQMHNLMIKNLGITPGLRTHEVGISGTAYRPLGNKFQIEEAMEKLVKAINENSNPIEKALIAISMISYIQPYGDGNKRTGRMLANAILLSWDLFPLSYRSIDEDEFKKALIVFYEQGSLYHLKRLVLEQVLFSFDNYFV